MDSKKHNLEIKFHKDMLNIYKNARKVGYNASRFKKMIANQGGLNVAKKFINSNSPSDGFTSLWELGRLDLTVEALILKEEYYTLFSEVERAIVKNRLKDYGFVIEENQPHMSNPLTIPDLEPVNRSREYHIYNDEIRSEVVFEYLFRARTHRWLDENIIGLNSNDSRGYQAMGILHHIGLKDKHKGLFKNNTLEEAISLMDTNKEFALVNKYLKIVKTGSVLSKIVSEDIDSELSEEPSYYTEGNIKEYYGKRYERSPENRKKAIEIHGLSCLCCGFNFEEIYGERGKDFIEVHHIKPLSTIKEEIVINPQTDLIPVCSNCHRMIHRKKDEILTVEELKQIIHNRNKVTL